MFDMFDARFDARQIRQNIARFDARQNIATPALRFDARQNIFDARQNAGVAGVGNSEKSELPPRTLLSRRLCRRSATNATKSPPRTRRQRRRVEFRNATWWCLRRRRIASSGGIAGVWFVYFEKSIQRAFRAHITMSIYMYIAVSLHQQNMLLVTLKSYSIFCYPSQFQTANAERIHPNSVTRMSRDSYAMRLQRGSYVVCRPWFNHVIVMSRMQRSYMSVAQPPIDAVAQILGVESVNAPICWKGTYRLYVGRKHISTISTAVKKGTMSGG